MIDCKKIAEGVMVDDERLMLLQSIFNQLIDSEWMVQESMYDEE